MIIYGLKGSLFDWYCYGVSQNQHKKWIKAFQIFLKKFIMREIYYELFRKNNEIQMKRMFSTSSEKPKSVTARSLQKKICKVS